MPESVEPGRALRPPALVAAALVFCVAELTAGYALIVTSGAVQMILTIFVVSAPLLIGGSLCYALMFHDQSVFSATRASFPGRGQVTSDALSDENLADRYDALAHTLFGVLDAIRQELPAAAEKMVLGRPTTIRTYFDLSLHDSLGGPSRPGRRNAVPRRTLGSVSRASAALRYPFLAEDYRRAATQRAIQSLATTEPNYFFSIRPDGTIHSLLNLNELQAHTVGRATDSDDLLLLQVLGMIQGQLIIAFLLEEDALAQPGPRLDQFASGIQNISIPLDRAALVISDEGDLYGTLSDVMERHQPLDVTHVAAS